LMLSSMLLLMLLPSPQHHDKVSTSTRNSAASKTNLVFV